MERNYRPCISKKWTATRVMSVQDALDIGKLMFTANEKGNDPVLAYLDFDDALTVCSAILGGQFSNAYPCSENQAGINVSGKFTKYGGTKSSSRYGGKAESRIIEVMAGVQDGAVKWAITIRNSEGVVNASTGTIAPAHGVNVISQRVYFTHEEMIKWASKIKLHLESYYKENFSELYDSNGDWANLKREDNFTTVAPSQTRNSDVPRITV